MRPLLRFLSHFFPSPCFLCPSKKPHSRSSNQLHYLPTLSVFPLTQHLSWVNSYLLPVTRHHFWVLLKENCTWTYRHLHTIFYSIYLLFIKTVIIPHYSLSVYMYAYINSDQKFQVLTHDILLANGWWDNSNLILSLCSARWFTRN